MTIVRRSALVLLAAWSIQSSESRQLVGSQAKTSLGRHAQTKGSLDYIGYNHRLMHEPDPKQDAKPDADGGIITDPVHVPKGLAGNPDVHYPPAAPIAHPPAAPAGQQPAVAHDHEEEHAAHGGAAAHEDVHAHGHDDHGHVATAGHNDHEHVEDSHGHEHDDHGHAAAAGHDDHGHGEGAHGHDAHHSDPAATLAAVMLLGVVGWVMSLFYFVNFPDPDVREATWTTLSAMIAIFCGVLIFSCIKGVIADFAGEPSGHHHGPPSNFTLCMNFLRFVIIYALLQVAYFRLRLRPLPLKYFSAIGGHVVGFAAIDFFGTALQMDMFSQSLFMCIVGVTVSAIAMFAIIHPAAVIRRKLYAGHDNHLWHHSCEEYEGEAFGLAVGLLLSMAIRMSITDDMPSVHGNPKLKTHQECVILLVIAIVMSGLVMLSSYGHLHMPENASLHAQRAGHLIQATMSMAMGWCLLYWGYWTFYNMTGDKDHVGGKMTMRIVMALVFSAFVFAMIILIDRIADRTGGSVEHCLRDLLITFALLMGLSWEAAFTEAIMDVSHVIGSPETRQYATVGLAAVLCAVVLPAWALFILPNTKECKELLEDSGAHDPHKSHA